MSLIRYGAVTLDDALGLLSARTCSPSTMGAQLEALAARAALEPAAVDVGDAPVYVKPPKQDALQAQANAENRMLREIATIRCLDALSTYQHAHVLKDRPALAKLHKRVPTRTQGELVLLCLRAYEEWRLTSKERALAAVHAWAQVLAPDAFRVPDHGEDDLAQAFRVGKAARSRQRAAELYADCYLVLAEWIASWNRRQIRAVA